MTPLKRKKFKNVGVCTCGGKIYTTEKNDVVKCRRCKTEYAKIYVEVGDVKIFDIEGDVFVGGKSNGKV